jgi:hypothetical protein
VQINENPASSAYSLLSDGRSSSPSTVSLSGKIPAHVRRVLVRVQHWGSSYVGFATSEMNFSLIDVATSWANLYGVQNSWGDTTQMVITLNESQEFMYEYGSDPGSGQGLQAGILSYLEER